MGVFHAKGWWPKTSCPPSKVCLPWVSKRGIGDVPGIWPGCPGLLGVFKKFVQKKFVRIFRSLFSCERLLQTLIFRVAREMIRIFRVFARSGPNCKIRKIRPTGLMLTGIQCTGFWCRYMSRLYSHPCEYSKNLLRLVLEMTSRGQK